MALHMQSDKEDIESFALAICIFKQADFARRSATSQREISCAIYAVIF